MLKFTYKLKENPKDKIAKVLANMVSHKPIFELSGTLLTYEQLAKQLNKSDTKFDLLHVSADEYIRILQTSGLPSEAIQFIVMLQKDIRSGQLDVPSHDLADILGHNVSL